MCHIATLEMEECGLTKDVLDDTDVLVCGPILLMTKYPMRLPRECGITC